MSLASAAFVIRQFSIVQRDASGNIIGVQNPYAEVDFKTSGGRDNYNALQLGLSRRSARGFRSMRNTRCRGASETRVARTFLNPVAFATPAPGMYGNLERGSLHGPNFQQVDLMLSKHVPLAGNTNVELRVEVFNLFNTVNFSNPAATLPNALPSNSLTKANKVQPGQPYTSAAAATFGQLQGTVGRTVGLGTSRQVQFACRFNF